MVYLILMRKLLSMSENRPNSSPIAILGISEKVINEFDSLGITLESFTSEAMIFNISDTLNSKRAKALIKARTGRNCRISYLAADPEEDSLERVILQRKYPVL